MKSGELSTLLNLPISTLHKYSQDYAEYLSPAGAGGAGRHREYTEQDARILKLILDMKAERVKPEDIDTTLASLKASNFERLPELDKPSQSIIPTPGALIAAGQRESALQALVDHLKDELKDARADRDELLKRLSRAEFEAEMYRSGRLKPD